MCRSALLLLRQRVTRSDGWRDSVWHIAAQRSPSSAATRDYRPTGVKTGNSPFELDRGGASCSVGACVYNTTLRRGRGFPTCAGSSSQALEWDAASPSDCEVFLTTCPPCGTSAASS